MNLGNPLENRYLRLEISFDYRGSDPQKAELDARTPQIRDIIVNTASRKTMEFLLGPDGKDQLRYEIFTKLNQILDKKIEAVYITDILVE
jgi:flagellar basal body-associated protein FliL